MTEDDPKDKATAVELLEEIRALHEGAHIVDDADAIEQIMEAFHAVRLDQARRDSELAHKIAGDLGEAAIGNAIAKAIEHGI